MRISDWRSDVCSSDLLHGKAELLIVGGPGKIKENLAFQPLRTGYARPAQSAAAGGASPEESPEETIDRLARGSLAKEPRPASLGGSPDLRRSACRTRILPMAMDRPGARKSTRLNSSH